MIYQNVNKIYLLTIKPSNPIFNEIPKSERIKELHEMGRDISEILDKISIIPLEPQSGINFRLYSSETGLRIYSVICTSDCNAFHLQNPRRSTATSAVLQTKSVAI